MPTATPIRNHSPSAQQQSAARTLVRAMEDAFNAKDAEALGRNLSEDAIWTNPLGVQARGRDRIVALARDVMARFATSHVRYEIAAIRAVSADVCVVNVHQIPTDRNGNALDTVRAVPLYVIARLREGWRIVAAQNTLVQEDVEMSA